MQVDTHRRAASGHLPTGVIVLLALSWPAMAHASPAGDGGLLRTFEKGAQAPPSQATSQPATPAPCQPAYQPPYDPSNPYAPAPPSCDRRDEDLGAMLAEELIGGAIEVAGAMGMMTLHRLHAPPEDGSRRNVGDFLVPFLRYDFFRQSVANNIFALDQRLEAGYGPLALLFEKSDFFQRAPADRLTMNRTLFLYRMSPVQGLELDLGLGQTTVAGVQSTTLTSYSVPLRVSLHNNIAIEFRPTWSGTMDDYEVAVHVGRQYGSLKIGYRYLSTAGAVLNGPFAGFSLYY